jgi:uncharacterized protein
MRRRIGIRGFVVVWALLGGLSCWAQETGAGGGDAAVAKENPVAKYKALGYVNDFAGLIDAKVQLEIEEVCNDLVVKRKTEMAIVTVESLEGVPIKEFSTDLFKRWGVGPKDTNRGVMVLLSRGDRQWRITVGRGLESVLTDEEAGKLGTAMRPMLRKGEYGEALLYAAKRIREEILQKVK